VPLVLLALLALLALELLDDVAPPLPPVLGLPPLPLLLDDDALLELVPPGVAFGVSSQARINQGAASAAANKKAR
jgi:hypothetical protein